MQFTSLIRHKQIICYVIRRKSYVLYRVLLSVLQIDNFNHRRLENIADKLGYLKSFKFICSPYRSDSVGALLHSFAIIHSYTKHWQEIRLTTFFDVQLSIYNNCGFCEGNYFTQVSTICGLLHLVLNVNVFYNELSRNSGIFLRKSKCEVRYIVPIYYQTFC